MKVVCVSDTHHRYGQGKEYPELVTPPGDVLIHAGDFTMRGQVGELAAFDEWLGRQPQAIKIIVPGNHDWLFQKDYYAAAVMAGNATAVLVDKGFTIGGLKIWGSPWQPEFNRWAFNLPRGEALAKKWGHDPY